MEILQESGKTLLHIRSHFQGLTKTEQKAAKYIMEHAPEVIYLSVTELASRADVGETTVLRLCRKLKFQGFQDFKLSLAQDLVQPMDYLHTEITDQDDAASLTQKLITSHIHTLEQTRELLNPEELGKAVDILYEAADIQFFGVGSSGLTAVQAAQSFLRIGKRSGAGTDTHFQAVEAALMTGQSVAVGISISGSTKDTNDNLMLAKRAGARIIAVTSNARSPITKIADIVLLMVARENPLQSSSLSAKISQLSIIDLLNAGVSLRMKDQALKYKELTAKATSDKLY
ncbi:MurR/RpiR family transcriptional regulator [Paenibacillus lemnae]|uniref:MurR/RpiR family transcriptional regulator n=1 Tax=Paenibacillus lemnae TaxID=1330551 RepID=A0A848M6D4_PAELE|nr:MurR/RpiR family transcriptional regulator [Paenibacillus lemnae]NMO96547.1 MurR/RpiR family transcriptional regulator [Paenibacillus lemnae]